MKISIKKASIKKKKGVLEEIFNIDLIKKSLFEEISMERVEYSVISEINGSEWF